ncbi:CPBP family intramembrane metalloprotease [Chloroflexota bacterium]|nr:CPBP family intramembrane metalloprotease [Chloroflexota bacterium]
MITEEIKEHSLWQSIFWHLLPGILGGIVYFLTVDLVNDLGFPSIVALILAGIFTLVPIQLGVLIYQSRKNKQKLFGEIVRYFEPLEIWEYFLWVFVIVIASGLIMGGLGPVSEFFHQEIFSGIPSIDMGLSTNYLKTNLIITYVFVLLFVVLIVPTVEELYFRGYLLPRMPKKLKKHQLIIHTTLFAVYHLWSPWMIVSRIFGVLPLAYVVMRKRNIYLGIIAHCLINSIDFFIGVVFITKMI